MVPPWLPDKHALRRLSQTLWGQRLVRHGWAPSATLHAAGLPAHGDLRPFDCTIGGGPFGAASAKHPWFRSTRILVLDGGPFLLPEHRQRVPVLGLNASGAHKDYLPKNAVWMLAWHSSDPIGFPGLVYCVGGRSVSWGGWPPRLLASELLQTVWPKTLLDDPAPFPYPTVDALGM